MVGVDEADELVLVEVLLRWLIAVLLLALRVVVVFPCKVTRDGDGDVVVKVVVSDDVEPAELVVAAVLVAATEMRMVETNE